MLYVHIIELKKKENCSVCSWRTNKFFVIARNKKEAERLYREKRIGMCVECLCEFLKKKYQALIKL